MTCASPPTWACVPVMYSHDIYTVYKYININPACLYVCCRGLDKEAAWPHKNSSREFTLAGQLLRIDAELDHLQKGFPADLGDNSKSHTSETSSVFLIAHQMILSVGRNIARMNVCRPSTFRPKPEVLKPQDPRAGTEGSRGESDRAVPRWTALRPWVEARSSHGTEMASWLAQPLAPWPAEQGLLWNIWRV